jgi:hypothetical protein
MTGVRVLFLSEEVVPREVQVRDVVEWVGPTFLLSN